jgi:hypothetical protein
MQRVRDSFFLICVHACVWQAASAFAPAALPICKTMVLIIQDVLGLNVNAFYSQANNVIDQAISTASDAICGSLLCTKTTGDVQKICQVRACGAPRTSTCLLT